MPCLPQFTQLPFAVVPVTGDHRFEWLSWTLIILLAAAATVLLLSPNARRWLRDFVIDHLRLTAALTVIGSALALVAYHRPLSVQPARARHSSSITRRSSGTPWPMDRRGVTRLGIVDQAPGPSGAEVVWVNARNDEAYYSSPCVSGNRIYCVASHGDNGRIVGLDADTGRQVWSAAPPAYRATFSSPVVADDLLLCGEGLHSARRARLVAIDLRAAHEGSILWTFPTSSHVECTPTISGGRVYFGAGDDGIYCLKIPNRESDRESAARPEVVFHLSGRDYPDAETSLAVDNGRLYVGLGVGGNALCVLDAHTGREIKRIAMPHPIFSPPAIVDQKLYVGMGGGDFAKPDAVRHGQVTCLDLSTLAVQWTQTLPGTVLGAIAADAGELYWGCGDGHVYRMRLADRGLDSYDTGAAIAASVAVTPSTVFAVNTAGTLVALDRSTWTLRFRFQLGAAGRYVSSPAVFGEYLVVGTPAEGLICLGRRGEPHP